MLLLHFICGMSLFSHPVLMLTLLFQLIFKFHFYRPLCIYWLYFSDFLYSLISLCKGS
jgi:hypothetical protein